MMQKPKKTNPHHDRHALRERPLLHQGQVPDDDRELGHVLLFVVVVVVVWGEIREKSSRSRERGREFLFSFESKIFIPVPKKKKAKTHVKPLRAARRLGRVDRRRGHQRPPGRDRGSRPGPAGRGVPAQGRRPRRRVGAGGGRGADPLVDHAGEAGGRVCCRGGVGALGAAAGQFLRGVCGGEKGGSR